MPLVLFTRLLRVTHYGRLQPAQIASQAKCVSHWSSGAHWISKRAYLNLKPLWRPSPESHELMAKQNQNNWNKRVIYTKDHEASSKQCGI